MKQEALLMLKSWYGKYHTHALFRLMKACSDGDDIVLIDDLNDKTNGQTIRSEVRIPMMIISRCWHKRLVTGWQKSQLSVCIRKLELLPGDMLQMKS